MTPCEFSSRSLAMRGGTSVRLRRDQRRRADAGPPQAARGSPGEVIVARRLTPAEQELLERERGHSDAGVHVRIFLKEEERFSHPRHGDKLAEPRRRAA